MDKDDTSVLPPSPLEDVGELVAGNLHFSLQEYLKQRGFTIDVAETMALYETNIVVAKRTTWGREHTVRIRIEEHI